MVGFVKFCGTLSTSLCALMVAASFAVGPRAVFGQDPEPTEIELFNCTAKCTCEGKDAFDPCDPKQAGDADNCNDVCNCVDDDEDGCDQK